MAIGSATEHCNIIHYDSDTDDDMPPLAHDDESDSDDEEECFGTQTHARSGTNTTQYYTPQEIREKYEVTDNFEH